MSIKRFFAYSIALHISLLIAAVSFMPPVKGDKKGEFFARLISPEELSSPLLPIPALPKLKPVPHTRSGVIMPAPIRKEDMLEEPESVVPYVPEEGSTRQGIKVEPESKGSTQEPDKVGPSIREKLFDRNIISDLAKRGIEGEMGEEKGKSNKTLTFDTKGYQFLIYNKRLKERIESIWVYPPDASAKRIYGDLFIRFTIKKDGRLGAVELLRTSGYKSLDDAAMKALRDGEPFWPLPDEWGMEAYTIDGHFIYTIYGYYIR
jgi:protein TonB